VVSARGTSWPANFTLKPLRPGFGPALKRLDRTEPARRHAGCRSRVAVKRVYAATCMPQGFGTWALAAQLSVWAVTPTDTERLRRRSTSVQMHSVIVVSFSAVAVSDTTLRAAAIQLQLYREAGPARRAQIAVELSDAVRETTLAGIRRRHPDYSAEQVKSTFIRIVYGLGERS
jgi:hypothetical protein